MSGARGQYRLWYTRRDGVVRGPFPLPVIQDHVLLGRLRETDELSEDRLSWRPLAQFPELIPEVMRRVVTEEDRQRLKQARLRADERLRERRRGGAGPGAERRGHDRRGPEPEALLRHRAHWNGLAARLQAARQHRLARPALLLILAGLAMAGLLYWTRPAPAPAPPPQCAAPARAGVNWSYCRLEGAALGGADLREAMLSNARLSRADLRGARLTGADLAYADLASARLHGADLRRARLVGASLAGADLREADLSGADLSYADLTGAGLARARLTGARLDKAIWPDGRVCAVGSLGGCAASPGP